MYSVAMQRIIAMRSCWLPYVVECTAQCSHQILTTLPTNEFHPSSYVRHSTFHAQRFDKLRPKPTDDLCSIVVHGRGLSWSICGNISLSL